MSHRAHKMCSILKPTALDVKSPLKMSVEVLCKYGTHAAASVSWEGGERRSVLIEMEAVVRCFN